MTKPWKYEEFEVELRSVPGGGAETRVLASPCGRGSEPFDSPFPAEELDPLLAQLEARVRHGGSKSRELVRPGRRTTGKGEKSPEEIGTALFQALFVGQIKELFDRSLGGVAERSTDPSPLGLRIKITFDRGADFGPLAAVPWELLFKDGSFLCRRRTPVVRHLAAGGLERASVAEGRLKVLVVDSAPIDLRSLDAPKERAAILRALGSHPQLAIEVYDRPNLKGLRERLRDGGYHALHFIGHGDFGRGDSPESTGDEGVLFFEDEHRLAAPVAGLLLADALQDFPALRLVFLNACRTGAFPRRRGESPYAGVAAALAVRGVPAVVAMQFPISDKAAIAFSETFYRRLAAFDRVETAVAEGRWAVRCAEETSLEWATPVLFLAAADGRLFTAHTAATPGGTGDRSKGGPEAGEPVRLGIRSRSPWGELEETSEEVLDLTEHFDDRWIRKASLWDEAVFPELRDFLLNRVKAGRPLVLDLAAHLSIAFAAGYCLEAKSGLDVTVIQRGMRGLEKWKKEWQAEPAASTDGPLWRHGEEWVLDPKGVDTVFAASVTHPVLDDVEKFLKVSPLAAGRILPVSLYPEPSPLGVRDGLHALQLAHRLFRKIRGRTPRERQGTLHLFVSAPNAVVFYLGQLSRAFGAIQLYEHDFDDEKNSPYVPSIKLPPIKKPEA